MTMTLSGSGTIGGLVAGGLPDATIVQADLASGVAGNGPAFSATQGSQTVNNAVFTKIACGTEEFDTASCYDSTTNYRFVPNIAGYYQVNGYYYLNSTSGGCVTAVYKNGSAAKSGSFSIANSYGAASTIGALIYLNGSTDYVELYSYQNTGSTVTGSGSYFQASMVRAA